MTRDKLADSPWLWLLLFSIIALAALASIQGKFAKRQSGIAFRAEARSAVVARAAGEAPLETTEAPPVPRLGAVAAILALVASVAAWRFWREAKSMEHKGARPDPNVVNAKKNSNRKGLQ